MNNTNAFKAIENELKRQKQYNCIDLSHLGIHIHNSSNLAFKLVWCQYTGTLGSPRELRFAFKRTDMQVAPTSWYHYSALYEILSANERKQIATAIKEFLTAKKSDIVTICQICTIH